MIGDACSFTAVRSLPQSDTLVKITVSDVWALQRELSLDADIGAEFQTKVEQCTFQVQLPLISALCLQDQSSEVFAQAKHQMAASVACMTWSPKLLVNIAARSFQMQAPGAERIQNILQRHLNHISARDLLWCMRTSTKLEPALLKTLKNVLEEKLDVVDVRAFQYLGEDIATCSGLESALKQELLQLLLRRSLGAVKIDELSSLVQMASRVSPHALVAAKHTLALRLEDGCSDDILQGLCECASRMEADEPGLQESLMQVMLTKCFMCPICASWAPKAKQQSCTNGHCWCSNCFSSWAHQPEQLNQMIGQRSLGIACLHGCLEHLPEDFTTAALGSCQCRSRHSCTCPLAARICGDMARRRALIERADGRACIDCPDPDCLGIAYGGQTCRMCFLCEHQWRESSFRPMNTGSSFAASCCIAGTFKLCGILSAPHVACMAAILPSTVALRDLLSTFREPREPSLPPGCKHCPSCRVVILKDGGCDHMRCRCGHEFYWSTGLTYIRHTRNE